MADDRGAGGWLCQRSTDGQLVRQEHDADGVVLVGFSSYQGSVIAGEEWGAPMRRMRVPPAREGSWEEVLHRLSAVDRLLVFDGDAPEEALEPRGHRAIGVVYHPERERYGNYVPSVLPFRYDAVIYLDRTTALQPLDVTLHPDGEAYETYPSGM